MHQGPPVSFFIRLHGPLACFPKACPPFKTSQPSVTPRSLRFSPSRNSAFFVILVLLTKGDNNLSLLKSIPSSDDKHLRDNDHILLFYRVNLSQPLVPQNLIRLPNLSWWMWTKKRQYTLGRQDIYLSSSNFLSDLLRHSIANVVILQTQLQVFPIYSEQAINLKVLPTRLSWSQLLSRMSGGASAGFRVQSLSTCLPQIVSVTIWNENTTWYP